MHFLSHLEKILIIIILPLGDLVSWDLGRVLYLSGLFPFLFHQKPPVNISLAVYHQCSSAVFSGIYTFAAVEFPSFGKFPSIDSPRRLAVLLHTQSQLPIETSVHAQVAFNGQ